jgi:predicted metal-dependent peptidase
MSDCRRDTFDTFDFERSLSASLLRLRAKAPFFATLALFARIEPTEHFDTAATDGRDIWINPNFWRLLSAAQADGLLLHEVLHAALLHVLRRGAREPLLWNFAADIMVNGVIESETPFALPPGALREKTLESFSVEEIYEMLQRDASKLPPLCLCDLLDAPPGSEVGAPFEGLDHQRRRLLETYWRQAREQAMFIASAAQRGGAPAGLARELGQLEPALLPWRDYLWRFLVRTPTDFQEFDRRFLARGLYLETLEGESVRVFICVDTSGSVSSPQMKAFVSEVYGILNAYPHLECDLFYADARVHGPYRLHPDTTPPKPVGGGGTDFRPFFDRVAHEDAREAVCVYLTDGHGTFPSEAPDLAVLWVVTPGGLDLVQFPFGETVRLLSG